MKKVPRTVLIRFSFIFSKIFSFFMRGNKYECPICGGKFRKLFPYGIKGRDNALCPKCLSLERHRLIWLYLKRETDFFTTPKKVLHVAPEQPFIKLFRKMNNLDYTTGDLESPLADIKFDIQNIPLADEAYDVVICNHVMEHIDDDKKAMSEVYRIMKKGGMAFMQVPLEKTLEKTYEDKSITNPQEREKHFRQRDHLRLYGRDYPSRLEKVGFKVTPVDYTKKMTAEEVKKYALSPREILYLIEKK
ncbi:MAG: class I SAM-dependent methyltransferase [Bacteroidota bacterium]